MASENDHTTPTTDQQVIEQPDTEQAVAAQAAVEAPADKPRRRRAS